MDKIKVPKTLLERIIFYMEFREAQIENLIDKRDIEVLIKNNEMPKLYYEIKKILRRYKCIKEKKFFY